MYQTAADMEQNGTHPETQSRENNQTKNKEENIFISSLKTRLLIGC